MAEAFAELGEALVGASGAAASAATEELRRTRQFELLDKDGSGKISYEEMVEAVDGDEALAERMMEAADADGDGAVDVDEYKAIVQRAAENK